MTKFSKVANFAYVDAVMLVIVFIKFIKFITFGQTLHLVVSFSFAKGEFCNFVILNLLASRA